MPKTNYTIQTMLLNDTTHIYNTIKGNLTHLCRSLLILYLYKIYAIITFILKYIDLNVCNLLMTVYSP